ncbi:tonB-system energizer ExbB [Brucella pseudogrignonensis]|nr:tonB-system energizer ExbB [Brucella pseudogrignonensis]MCD4512136.1 tonB-system energizer ExbB [Brucella pseudogrignonensis]
MTPPVTEDKQLESGTSVGQDGSTSSSAATSSTVNGTGPANAGGVAQPDAGFGTSASDGQAGTKAESGQTGGENALDAGQTLPAGGEAGEASVVEVAAPEHAPSFLDDPAGAITHMLDIPARNANLPHDLSPWGMFLAADWVVKGVMLGLAFASLVTWTVWLAKSLELAGAKARVNRTLKDIRASRTLSEALGRVGKRRGPAALMLQAAKEEAELSEEAIDLAGGDGLKERVGSALGRIEATAGRRISKGTGVLATIGSTAPFVGLFGTVWGIMNSFIGISEAQTTNLAVVAPGIAEALLATAIGLVAAIPAVVIYNVFARSITGYRQMLADAASGVERLVSRDIDFRKVNAQARTSPADSPASPASPSSTLAAE